MSWVSAVTNRIEMMDNKIRSLAIALIVFLISLTTISLDHYELWLEVLRTLQTMATAALVFAIFKRDALHKDRLVLFWLIISAIQCTTWVNTGFRALNRSYYYYYCNRIACTVAYRAFCNWSMALIVGYMMYLMYQDYVRLIECSRNAPNTVPEVIETKEMPPPYMAPTSGSSSVAILGPEINV